MNGERRLVSAGESTTDDQGTYRIFGLAAGDYVVGAAARGPGGAELRLTSDADVRHAAAANSRTPPPPDRSVTFTTIYYPGSTMASQAGLVSVRAGEERDGVDITLQLVPTARVEGTVSLPGASLPRGAEVNLIASGPSELSGSPFDSLRSGGPAPDGSFSFANVPPGQYTVHARAARPIERPDGAPAGPPLIVWASDTDRRRRRAHHRPESLARTGADDLRPGALRRHGAETAGGSESDPRQRGARGGARQRGLRAGRGDRRARRPLLHRRRDAGALPADRVVSRIGPSGRVAVEVGDGERTGLARRTVHAAARPARPRRDDHLYGSARAGLGLAS